MSESSKDTVENINNDITGIMKKVEAIASTL